MFIRKKKTRKKPQTVCDGEQSQISGAQRDRWCHWATVLQSYVINKLTDAN